jgi:hypothetical protein
LLKDLILKTSTAVYLKEKDALDRTIAADLQVWANQCAIDGHGTSTILLDGIWEREEKRARHLCERFWNTAIDLALKQNHTLTANDEQTIRQAAEKIIETELSQAKASISDWVKRTMPSLDSHYNEHYVKARRAYRGDLEREFTIRRGLAEISAAKAVPLELTRSTLVEKDFAFISDDDLRRICKRDYEEVQRVQIAEAHKATMILCGSLTEALLLDALQKNDAKATSSPKAASGPLTKWSLHDLLEVSVDLGLINPGSVALAKGIQDYRNLIHPGREIRTRFHVGAEEATISRQFLELVIRDLSRTSTS